MTQESSFGDRPDPTIRSLIESEFEGPDPERFLGRLRRELAVLPARDTEWDVLAHWARPGVLAAAMAAGMLLGLTFWKSWRDRPQSSNGPAMSVALLEEPRITSSPIVYTVLGER